MANGLNKVQLIGNLGKDPEMRYTPSGKAVTSASLAVNRSYTNGGGEKVEETEWFNLEFWGKLAEIVNQYAAKGRKIYVEGRLKTEKYEKDGETRYFTKVICHECLFLSSGGKEPEAAEEDIQFA